MSAAALSKTVMAAAAVAAAAASNGQAQQHRASGGDVKLSTTLKRPTRRAARRVTITECKTLNAVADSAAKANAASKFGAAVPPPVRRSHQQSITYDDGQLMPSQAEPSSPRSTGPYDKIMPGLSEWPRTYLTSARSLHYERPWRDGDRFTPWTLLRTIHVDDVRLVQAMMSRSRKGRPTGTTQSDRKTAKQGTPTVVVSRVALTPLAQQQFDALKRVRNEFQRHQREWSHPRFAQRVRLNIEAARKREQERQRIRDDRDRYLSLRRRTARKTTTPASSTSMANSVNVTANGSKTVMVEPMTGGRLVDLVTVMRRSPEQTEERQRKHLEQAVGRQLELIETLLHRQSSRAKLVDARTWLADLDATIGYLLRISQEQRSDDIYAMLYTKPVSAASIITANSVTVRNTAPSTLYATGLLFKSTEVDDYDLDQDLERGRTNVLIAVKSSVTMIDDCLRRMHNVPRGSPKHVQQLGGVVQRLRSFVDWKLSMHDLAAEQSASEAGYESEPDGSSDGDTQSEHDV